MDIFTLSNGDKMAKTRNKHTTTKYCLQLPSDLTPEERDKAKALAKSQGMMFQGWLGNLVRNEIKESCASNPASASTHAGDIGRAYEN